MEELAVELSAVAASAIELGAWLPERGERASREEEEVLPFLLSPSSPLFSLLPLLLLLPPSPAVSSPRRPRSPFLPLSLPSTTAPSSLWTAPRPPAPRRARGGSGVGPSPPTAAPEPARATTRPLVAFSSFLLLRRSTKEPRGPGERAPWPLPRRTGRPPGPCGRGPGRRPGGPRRARRPRRWRGGGGGAVSTLLLLVLLLALVLRLAGTRRGLESPRLSSRLLLWRCSSCSEKNGKKSGGVFFFFFLRERERERKRKREQGDRKKLLTPLSSLLSPFLFSLPF